MKNYQTLSRLTSFGIPLLLCLSCSTGGGSRVFEKRDTIEILNCIANSRNFAQDFRELASKDNKIHLVKNKDATHDRWPAKIGNIKFEVLNNFNTNRTFSEQAADPKFTISSPKFSFKMDTALISIYNYKFYMEYTYKFVKKNNKWILMEEHALMQKN